MDMREIGDKRAAGVHLRAGTDTLLPRVDAVRLQDGRAVVVYNYATTGRTPLNLAVSRDLGKTWTPGPVLESDPGEYSYPAILQSRDGTIHIGYTWKRQRIRYVRLRPEELPA